jgi:dolichol-phosphate mannosyltransferase
MDGDGTHRPSDLPKILSRIQNCDVVIGSRFLAHASMLDWSFTRRFLTHTGHLVTKIGLGSKFDCSSGMRAYNLSKIDFSFVRLITSEGYDFFYKSIFIFEKKLKLNIQEVPLVLLPRQSGKSKLTFFLAISSIIKLLLDVFKFRKKNFLNRY